jgi:hypothetical protein
MGELFARDAVPAGRPPFWFTFLGLCRGQALLPLPPGRVRRRTPESPASPCQVKITLQEGVER